MSLELAASGITVNNILPGATKTQRLDTIIENQAIKKFPEAKESIKHISDKIVHSEKERAMQVYAKELKRLIASNDQNAVKNIRKAEKYFDKHSDALSEGFGLKFWTYIVPGLIRLILIIVVALFLLKLIMK